jgi:hypothetical protein
MKVLTRSVRVTRDKPTAAACFDELERKMRAGLTLIKTCAKRDAAYEVDGHLATRRTVIDAPARGCLRVCHREPNRGCDLHKKPGMQTLGFGLLPPVFDRLVNQLERQRRHTEAQHRKRSAGYA